MSWASFTTAILVVLFSWSNLARYISSARRIGSNPQRPARASRKAPAAGVNPNEIREWARAQDIEVKDRGRVPADLMVKFQAATGA